MDLAPGIPDSIPRSGKIFAFHPRQLRILTLGSFARTRTLSRGEVPLLSSGWTLIGSKLSSPNFNSSVRVVTLTFA